MSANENDFYFYKLVRGFLCNYLPVQRRCSNATIKNYKDSINQYRIYLLTCKKIPFNKVGFSCFSRSEIYDFCVWLRDAQHKSVNTVNLRLAAIKSFLSYCSYEDPSLTEVYLQVKSIKRFKGEINPKLEYLTSKQLEALFACPDISTTVGRRNRYFMIHAYETGGRVDELVNMQVGDIIRNGKNIQICLHGKGNKTRYIPLACDVVPHLNAYLAEFHSDPQNEDYLFYTIHNGEHTKMSPRTVNAFLSKYAKALNQADQLFPENLHCHVLRHSIGMTLFKAGVPISYIKDFLGHTSIDSTSIYAHADIESMEEVLQKVNQAPVCKSDKSNPTSKRWKGNEEYLINYCGLS